MPLHPFIEALLRERGSPPLLKDFTAAQIRRGFVEQCSRLAPAPDALADVKDLDLAPGLRARTYRPQGTALPLLLYFHGGGFVIGDLDTHDGLCRRLAARTPCVVLSVDYRLAPEHPFPAAVEDAWMALAWAHATAATLGADAARIGVGGDSAGGAIAAGLSLRCRERGVPLPRAQLLLYPTLDHPSANWPSYAELARGYGLTRESMEWFWAQYVGANARPPPEAAPLRAADHSRLPPTLVYTAEYDLLRDEAEAYAQRLVAAGVDARVRRWAGMNHGFAALGGYVEDADRALNDASAWLQETL